MIMMVSDKDIAVHGDAGGVVILKAKEPKDIHERFYNAAVAAGAYEAGKPRANRRNSETTDESKLALIKTAIEEVAKEGNPDDFDATNQPKLAVLKSIVGFKVTTKMRDEALKSLEG